MTTAPDRFSIAKNDLVFLPSESDRDRADAFLEAFELSGEGGTFEDVGGHSLMISPAWVEGLDHYAARELANVASAIVDPTEIREVWKKGANGSAMLTRRYIAEGDAFDVVADVNRAGWTFATSQEPRFDLDDLRTGTRVWPASSKAS